MKLEVPPHKRLPSTHSRWRLAWRFHSGRKPDVRGYRYELSHLFAFRRKLFWAWRNR
ncbi:hypothetical protein BV22DRAFT_1028860 [Leucogyrophana mollusca]|uniref:Uncharacterized protein n=2 Tax=Leucogyrophana mollusca TaxID=85980 RepID=A0ACB8AZT0_9AGAM|nr:hypothetical protein BV22DRAFT_1041502 [Leucogyrophana mollusca]KAH7929909.1 hypothetical protein BV22DRAFT_1028860 [Leucogyrophana mollusca]